MPKLVLSLFILFITLLSHGQSLSFSALVELSQRDTSIALDLLKDAKWSLSSATKGRDTLTSSWIFEKTAISNSKEQVVLLPQSEDQTVVGYYLKSDTAYRALFKAALDADYAFAFEEDTEDARIYYLLKDSSELVGFHILKDKGGIIATGFFISVYSFDTWLLNTLTHVVDQPWSRDTRAEFMLDCFKAALSELGAAEGRKYCSCMLGSLEGMYPDSDKAAELSEEQILELAKKCINKVP